MIRASTLRGALAPDLAHETGSITGGKAAALVVQERNLFEIPAHEISEAKDEMTSLGGRVVYRAR
jgi:predicted amidohydrolase YtcJ